MKNQELRDFCQSLQNDSDLLQQPAQAKLFGLGVSTLKAQLGSGNAPDSVRGVGAQTEKIAIMLKLLKQHAPAEFEKLLIKAIKESKK